MQIVAGKAIMEQIVVGRLNFYRRPVPQVQLYTQGDWRQEINRFHRAQQTAILELNTLYTRALYQVGEGVASIFTIHGMLLEDHDYVETVRGLIQGQGPPWRAPICGPGRWTSGISPSGCSGP